MSTRKKVLVCYVWSTLLYCSDTWTLNNDTCKKLEAFELWCYRRMLKIAWSDRVTNEEVLIRIGEQRKLLSTIKSRKLRLFGHLVRHDSLQKRLIEGQLNGRRVRGRPMTTWMTNISAWTGLSYAEAVRIAQNRQQWRRISSQPRGEEGT